MELELAGKVALVTGASQGLGRAMAIGLANEGATVIASARSADRLAELGETSDRLHAMPADLTDEDQISRLPDRVVAEHGRIDILVNNAGIAPAGGFVDQDPEVWRQTLAVNVVAPMLLTQAAGRHFLGQGSGKVINVASTTGLRGKPLLVGYAASKGAMLRMTESLAAEWAKHGVQVNAIAPGAFETEAQSAVLESEELHAKRVRRIPQRRMAQPEEIVELTCLLASPRSSFITGSVFVIDGGESGKL